MNHSSVAVKQGVEAWTSVRLKGSRPLTLTLAHGYVANSQELSTQTAGKCKYIEEAFEETFNANTLNFTRWKESSIHGTVQLM